MEHTELPVKRRYPFNVLTAFYVYCKFDLILLLVSSDYKKQYTVVENPL